MDTRPGCWFSGSDLCLLSCCYDNTPGTSEEEEEASLRTVTVLKLPTKGGSAEPFEIAIAWEAVSLGLFPANQRSPGPPSALLGHLHHAPVVRLPRVLLRVPPACAAPQPRLQAALHVVLCHLVAGGRRCRIGFCCDRNEEREAVGWD